VARAVHNVVFVDGVRSPFGRAGSAFKETRADDLVVKVFRELLRRNPEVPVERIDDVAVAATTQMGDQGMTIGRSASLLAGIPHTVPGYSVDRMCAGAMTAVTTLSGAIMAGAYDIALAGGVESMSRHPMGEGMDPNPRFLSERVVDLDALSMGATAENIHDRFPHLTKARADAFALGSQRKTAEAYANGWIQPDLVPIAMRSAELGWGLMTVDEAPRPETSLEGLAALKTPFRPHGRVTAGNSSGLNDGATAALLASEAVADELGLNKKMRMVGFAFAGVEPEIMGIGPVPSTEKALRKAGMSISDVDLFEVNEAFAVQVLAFLDHFGLDDDDPRVNPMGGAIAVGHPLASSGIRLMTYLARDFERNPQAQYGITTMCIGLGMGGTVIWENVNYQGSKA
jgi:acetyl-CoA acyltransferase